MLSAWKYNTVSSYRFVSGLVGLRVGRSPVRPHLNRKQFFDKLSDSLSRLPASRHYPDTAYHPQINEQAEQLRKTIGRQFRHSMADQQTDWDQYL